MTTSAPASTSASTQSPKCNCPLALKKTCDIKKLKLAVTPKKGGEFSSSSKIGFSFGGSFEEPKPKSLEAPFSLRKQVIPAPALKKLGKNKAGLLQKYDLVIETTAAFAMGNKAPASSVQIELEAEWEGECPTHEHGLISMRVLSSPVALVRGVNNLLGNQSTKLTGRQAAIEVVAIPKAKGQTGEGLGLQHQAIWAVKTQKVQLKEVYAQPTDFDLGKASAGPLSIAIRMLRMAWAFLTPMDFEFTADTHGVLDDRSRTPNHTMLGLVRVYRETAVGVELKFPPVSKTVDVVAQRGMAIDEKKEKEVYALLGGYKESNTTTLTAADKLKREKEEQAYKPLAYELLFKLNDLELKLSERSTYEEADELAKKKAEAKERNAQIKDRAYLIGVLWQIGEWKTAIKMVWEDLVKAIKTGRKILTSFFDWTKRFPQLGWKLEYEMNLFAGSMGVKFTQGDGDIVLERYATLKWKGSFEIKLTVLEAKAKISFGIVVDFGPVGSIDIRVFGELTGTIEAGFEKTFMHADPDDGEKTVKIGGKVSGRLGAIAAVESFIYTWKREIFIEAGIAVEGQIKWFKEKTDYAIVMKTLPVTWQFIAKNSRTKEAVARVHTLCEEARLLGYQDSVKAT